MSLSTRVRFFSVLALSVFGIVLVGCDSGGEQTEELAKEDAKQAVQNADGSLDATASDLRNGKAAKTAARLFDLGVRSNANTNGKSDHTPLGQKLLRSLDEQSILTTSPNGQLNFQTGEYIWEGSSWSSDGSSDNLVLHFPSARDQQSNDLTFTLSKYEDAEVTVESENAYLPTGIEASLTQDGTEIFSVDLSGTEFYDATVGSSDETLQPPKRFLLKVLTAPQFHTFDFSSSSKQDFTFDFALEKDGEGSTLALGLLVNAKLTKNFDEFSSDELAFDKLSGDFDLGPNLTFEYQIDVDGLKGLDESPPVSDVNDKFSVTVKSSGDKVGIVEFADSSANAQELPLVVKYNNGDTEPLAEAFPNAFGQIGDVGTIPAASKSLDTIGGKIKMAVFSLF